MKKIILISLCILPNLSHAQLGIGTTTPHQSAALDIASDKQGLLPPRMTTAQRDAIAEPSEGLVIYNTTDKCLQYWDSETWKCSVSNTTSSNTSNLCFAKKVKTFHNDFGYTGKVGSNFLIDDSGAAWYWGTPSGFYNKNDFFPEGTTNYLHDNATGFTSPFKINLPEPIKKIRTSVAGLVFALSETGKLYLWGDDSSMQTGAFGKGGYNKLPSPNSTSNFAPENLDSVIGENNTIVDLDLWELENSWFHNEADGTSVASVIISSDGKAYFAGTGTGGGWGSAYSENYVTKKSWTEIKTPHSGSYPQGFPTGYDSTGFKYTKVWGGRNIILEGENNSGEKIYFAFGQDTTENRLLLNDSYNNVSGNTIYKNSVHPDEHPLHVQLPAQSIVVDVDLQKRGTVFQLEEPNTFYYTGIYLTNAHAFPTKEFIPLVQPIPTLTHHSLKFTRKPTKLDMTGIAQNTIVTDIIQNRNYGLIAATSNGLYSVGQTSPSFPQLATGNDIFNTPSATLTTTQHLVSSKPIFFEQWTLAKQTEGKSFKELGISGIQRLLMLDSEQQLRVYANISRYAIDIKSSQAAAGIGTYKTGMTSAPTCLANPDLDPNYK